MFQVASVSFLQGFSTPKPSPLALRDPNACPHFSIQMASARKAGDENAVYSHKRTQNPLLQRKASERHDHRRQVFLKKVKKDGDDRNWESRSERILREEFLASQKQWEIEQARTAPEMPSGPEEEEQDGESFPTQEIEMVDQIIFQEDQSIEDLVSSMQHAEDDGGQDDQHHATSDYGSDEEEYEQLFMDVLSTTETVEGYVGEAAKWWERGQGHEMDVSSG